MQTDTLNGSIPFYAMFHDTNNYYKVHDERVCGGSCYEYLTKYLDFFFIEDMDKKSASGNNNIENDNFVPRICTAEDIGHELFDQGIMYLCPP